MQLHSQKQNHVIDLILRIIILLAYFFSSLFPKLVVYNTGPKWYYSKEINA